MNVNSMEGYALDYWAAKALGHRCKLISNGADLPVVGVFSITGALIFAPSEHVAQAWPIILAAKIGINPPSHGSKNWQAYCHSKDSADAVCMAYAHDPLVAAMRVFICSIYGEKVPDEI